MFCFGVDVGG